MVHISHLLGGDEVSSLVCTQTLLRELIKRSVGELRGERIKIVWEQLDTLLWPANARNHPHPRLVGDTLSILCYISSDLFVDSSGFYICQSNKFWNLLELALQDAFSATKKRALYLLKCAYTNSPVPEVTPSEQSPVQRTSISEEWDNFFCVFNALDDGNLSIIRPLWPNLTSVLCSEVIPFRWAEILLCKALYHQNMPVQRFAITAFLTTPDPIAKKLPESFLLGPALGMLASNASLYLTQGNSSLVSSFLTTFIDRPLFLHNLLNCLAERSPPSAGNKTMKVSERTSHVPNHLVPGALYSMLSFLVQSASRIDLTDSVAKSLCALIRRHILPLHQILAKKLCGLVLQFIFSTTSGTLSVGNLAELLACIPINMWKLHTSTLWLKMQFWVQNRCHITLQALQRLIHDFISNTLAEYNLEWGIGLLLALSSPVVPDILGIICDHSTTVESSFLSIRAIGLLGGWVGAILLPGCLSQCVLLQITPSFVALVFSTTESYLKLEPHCIEHFLACVRCARQMIYLHPELGKQWANRIVERVVGSKDSNPIMNLLSLKILRVVVPKVIVSSSIASSIINFVMQAPVLPRVCPPQDSQFFGSLDYNKTCTSVRKYKWKILSTLCTSLNEQDCGALVCHDSLISLVDACTSEELPELLAYFRFLFSRAHELHILTIDNFRATLEICWRHVKSNNNASLFEHFSSLCFSNVSLQLDAREGVPKWIPLFTLCADRLPGVLNGATSILLDFWIENQHLLAETPANINDAKGVVNGPHLDTLINLLLFGPPRAKGATTEDYLIWAGDFNIDNAELSYQLQRDHYVRAATLAFVSRNTLLHIKCAVISSLLQLSKTAEFLNERVVMFSIQDRKRHRLWQAICVLLPGILGPPNVHREIPAITAAVVDLLTSVIVGGVNTETKAPERVLRSVAATYLILWQLHQTPSHTSCLLELILQLLSDHSGGRPSTLQMAVSVASHVLLNINQNLIQKHAMKLILSLTPHISGPLMIRTIVQSGLLSFSQRTPSPNLPGDVLSMLKCICSTDDIKPQPSLLPWLIFGKWLPFTPDAILHDFAIVLGFSSTDVISPFLCEHLFATSCLPQMQSTISAAAVESQMQKVIKSYDDQLGGLTVSPQQPPTEEVTDWQRKIMPWMVSEGAEITRNPSRSTLHRGGLVVVASLVDRVPNLGGLCRTCEIFSVQELIISNIDITRQPEFTNVSATAETWLPIHEVRPGSLAEYLQCMKQERGYTIVGVEQTARSVMLDKAKFAKNTVLVLGNENNGVPTELMHLLDWCVEVPQSGVLRSLNVHVTGSIVVWEYTKQHSKQP
ncbi:RNA methyltransferase [Pelomyxa schiedti]|nr:RNA methyltransferase [Pelomyxa schiedti]